MELYYILDYLKVEFFKDALIKILKSKYYLILKKDVYDFVKFK